MTPGTSAVDSFQLGPETITELKDVKGMLAKLPINNRSTDYEPFITKKYE